MLPKKEQGKFRWLMSHFIGQLLVSRTTPTSPRDIEYHAIGAEEPNESGWKAQHRAKVRAKIDEEITHNKSVIEGAKREADRTEREIWDLQAKAGCEIAGEELVARDAEREGEPDVAAKLRAQRRRPPTPHKRPAKIR